VGTYTDDAMFTRLTHYMEAIGVAVIQPKIVA
jgi:hypothetical protein